MATLKNHASGGIPPDSFTYPTSVTPPRSLEFLNQHASRPRQFKRLETLRPMTSWLCPNDFTRLEKMRHETPPLDVLLGRLLCTKLADAHLLDETDDAHRYAAFGDIIAYSLNNGPLQTALLGIPETKNNALSDNRNDTDSDDLAYVDLRSFIGITVLGLKPGQHARLLSKNCTVGTITLHSID